MENNGLRSAAFTNENNTASQNFASTWKQQPLVAPTESETESEAPSKYSIQLLALYAQRVAETGEIGYPPLEQYLDQVYQVAIATENSLLLPETVEKLVAGIHAAATDVENATAEITQACDRALLLHQEDSLSVQQKSELKAITCQATERILQAFAYLLDLTNTHFPNAESKMRSQKQDSEECQKQMLVVKLKNDLYYFCQYLQERAPMAVILEELHWELRPQAYFRRLQEYLAIIPGVTQSLANLLQKTLEAKIPSNSTTQPRSYRS
jgi:hypothetical protein